MSQYKSESEFLEHYDASRYDRPSVSVDTLVFTVSEKETDNYRKLPEKVLQVLLIKRKDYPEKDKWAIPGGFVNIDENLEDAALRELKEETNVDDIYLEQLYTYGDVNRDPRTRVISCTYLSLADSSSLDIKAGDDASQAMWFDVTCKLVEEQKTIKDSGYISTKRFKISIENETYQTESFVDVVLDTTNRHPRVTRKIVDKGGLAFDHALIIYYGLERLRNKIEYTDIAFNLMGEYFTLTELQQVYEVILDKELLKANFRRKIADMVIETNKYTKDAGHRPSKLYKFNPNWADEHIERKN